MGTTALSALATRIKGGVLRRGQMSIKDIQERSKTLGLSAEETKSAIAELYNDYDLITVEGTVYKKRVYNNMVAEDFWEHCPFVTEQERTCNRQGWKTDECKRLLMTPAELHKEKRNIEEELGL